MKLDTRTFKAQLFWNQVTRVAETVDSNYWYVVRGSTPKLVISEVLRGHRRTRGGYIWKYAIDGSPLSPERAEV